ncbi:sigma factor-like helix-turn-helix DNA-binding protein [Sphingomonas sp. 3-13AW]|uniref:sigma factor-like helix-turn-helix DNA-binding protein n=1 Tax=Sphingomonas sp. 3-13AW TaxID=3050450 RepID=UPI003BB5AC54
MSGEINRRQRRDLDLAISNLDRMLKSCYGKIIRKKYMTDMGEDCAQVCQMGILAAVRSFDPSRSSFSTHVYNQMRAAVGDLKHKMKPESRNIQTIVPVRHVSLFTPLQDDGGTSTLADVIEDPQAQNAIFSNLEVSMVYQQIDRAYSHYLGRSEGRRTGRLATPSGLRLHRLNKLREREVFVRYFLQKETLEVIATDHEITRERVRQIAARIYTDPEALAEAEAKDGRTRQPGALNRYLVTAHVSEDCSDGYHPVWDEYVALAWVENGRDIRLSPTALDLSLVDAASVEFHLEDSLGILPEPEDDAVATIVEDVSDEESDAERVDVPMYALEELPLFSVPPKPSRRNAMLRRVASATVGVAMAATMANAAAAQSSRAIPPEEFETGVSRVHKAETTTLRARPRSLPATTTVLDASKIVLPHQAYGVKVASYPSVGKMQASWAGVRSGWDMLKGLHPAALETATGQYALVFGPVTQEQAVGVCHEAKRRPRECEVTKFGRQKNISKKSSRPSARG